MTEPNAPAPQEPVNPTRRDRLRPLELIGFSVVLGVFAAAVVLGATRDIVIALIALGVGFIVSVMMVALVGLGGKPSQQDIEARKDLKGPKNDWH